MRAVLVCALIFVVAYAAAADETEMEEVASFVETSADIAHLQAIGSEGESEQEVDAEGFPVPLTKKQRRTTMEPRYFGDPKIGRKKYVVPEYAVPKAPKKPRKNAPRVFSSHYFSPMPKPRALKCKTKKCRRAWKKAQRRRRRNQPLKSIETYQHHRINQKGFVQPEIIANYPGGARGEHLAKKAAKRPKPFGLPKKTLAPAPIVKFLEISSDEAADAVDTSEAAEEAAAAADAEDNASEFSEEELAGREQVTVLSGPEQFYAEGFQAPDWADEQMADEEESSEEDAAEAEGEEESEVAEDSEEEDSEAAEAEEDTEVALLEENDEEESEEEADEESEEEADEENEDEADEENEDESEEETEEVALIEASAEAQEEDEDEEEESDESDDAEESAVDELTENEEVAEQIDMDASEDDADSDEEMEEEEEADEENDDEAQDSEEAETEANEEAVAEMFEVDEHLAGADTLLAEVDAHLTAHNAGEVDADAEAEAKGTPGSAISAGMTWEDAQNAKLDAMEQQLATERAMTPKVAAKVVSSVAELDQLDGEHQMPEFDSDEAPHAETVAPEMVDA